MEYGETLRPQEKVRDLIRFKRYQHQTVNELGHVSHGAKGLKKLSNEFLNVTIQEGAHSSVIDARASMALYRLAESEWENQVKQKYAQVKEQVEAEVKKINSFFQRKEEEPSGGKKKKRQRVGQN